MPKHSQTFTIDITPERFVRLCSEIELREVLMLASARLDQIEKVETFRRKRNAMVADVRNCRVCGCTDTDCSQCIEKTGELCYWVEEDLCSACARTTKIGMFRE